MTARPAGPPGVARNRSAAILACCLLLVLQLWSGRITAQDVPTVGAGTSTDIATSEHPTLPPLVAAVINRGRQRMAGGHEHSLIVAADGSLWAWGSNRNGQLGDGTTLDRVVAVPVMTGVAAVAAGSNHRLGIKTDGSLWAWGWNQHRELGDGTTTDQARPSQVRTGVAAVAAGAHHTLISETQGDLWAWGASEKGQLGNGRTAGRRGPVRVVLANVDVHDMQRIAAGECHSLAIDTDGALWVWGCAGDDPSAEGARRAQVRGRAAAVAAGWGHALAIQTDGSLWAWGRNLRQLGDGTSTGPPQSGAGVLASRCRRKSAPLRSPRTPAATACPGRARHFPRRNATGASINDRMAQPYHRGPRGAGRQADRPRHPHRRGTTAGPAWGRLECRADSRYLSMAEPRRRVLAVIGRCPTEYNPA